MVAVTTSSPVPTSISDINLDGGTGPDEIKPKENNKNRSNKNAGKAFLYFFLHTLMFYLFAESGPASLLKSTKNKITGPASKLLSKKSGQIVLQSNASGKTSVPVVYQLPGNWKVPQNSRAFFLNWTNYYVTESLLVNITMLLFFKNGLAAYWSATWIVVCQMAFLLETAQYLATLAAPNQNKPNYFSAQYWSYQAPNL